MSTKQSATRWLANLGLMAALISSPLTVSRPVAGQGGLDPAAGAEAPRGFGEWSAFRVTLALRSANDYARASKVVSRWLGELPKADVRYPLQMRALVTGAEQERLTRMGIRPALADELNALLEGHANDAGDTVKALKPVLAQLNAGASERISERLSAADAEARLRSVLVGLSVAEANGLNVLTSLDDDGDGLTNTQEAWWCTNPLNANSDGDANGWSDSREVFALLDVMLPRTVRWGYGPPFGPPNAWPDFNGADGNPNTPACNDGDFDTIPDYAEVWMVGTRVPEESTDQDKFDDGQELFGTTYCPGAPTSCGYGTLPAGEYWNYIKATMPSWVRPPGDSPFVAAYPVPQVTVEEGSWRVDKVTTITTQQGQMAQTSRTYGSEARRGQSTAIANQKNWNNWEEVSESIETPLDTGAAYRVPPAMPEISAGKLLLGTAKIAGGIVAPLTACTASAIAAGVTVGGLAIPGAVICGGTVLGGFAAVVDGLGDWSEGLKPDDSQQMHPVNIYNSNTNIANASASASAYASAQVVNNIDFSSVTAGLNGVQYAINQQGALMARGLSNVSFSIDKQTAVLDKGLSNVANAILAPRYTETHTNGRSWGGAQTVTNEEYEEHALTEQNGFTTGENWSTAWAVDSSHAANLVFTYTIENVGTEYARELTGLLINVYLNDELISTYPAHTQFAGGKLENLFPADTPINIRSNSIPLTLDQMRRVDTGGRFRVVVEDFSFGADELFYQNAAIGGVTFYIEDGVDDSDESVDTYVIPTWQTESIEQVLTRYFPGAYDADGLLNSLWTPEFNGTNPPVFKEHFLSDLAWWNIYMTQPDAGNTPLRDLPAEPGSAVLIRMNRDSDRDGYQDRVEMRNGTGRNDPASHPNPEILAGYVSTRTGNLVTVTVALENSGTFDAYGIQVTMYSPDDTTTVIDNIVGGNGRVRPGQHVAVGSFIKAPVMGSWSGSTAKPYAVGDYSGPDRTFTFTVSAPGTVGSGSTAVAWAAAGGISGTLSLGASYHAPLPANVKDGFQVGFNTGALAAGNWFTVTALSPRDTLRYLINTDPNNGSTYTQPVIVVSANDPQGNRRFVTPIELSNLSQSLAPYAGQMLTPLEFAIRTNHSVTTTGPNTTAFVFNSPHSAPIIGARLHLDFVADGARMLSISRTLDIQSGPNIVQVDWTTAAFSETYDANKDNILIAHWTDNENNIIDTAARPLNLFLPESNPVLAMPPLDGDWDFGSAAQGTLMKRSFAFANVGLQDMLTYIQGVPGLSLSQTGSRRVSAADQTTYEIALNTIGLPVGVYDQSIIIRSSDPARPTQTVRVHGTVSPAPGNTQPGPLVRPLDVDVVVTSGALGQWVTFTHVLGPDAQSLHPVKIYDAEYSTLKGAGRYATEFAAGTASYDMFGDGRDGVMPGSGNLDNTNGYGVGVVNSGSAGATSIAVTDAYGVARINPGDWVIIHQTQGGAGAGCWELNKALSDFGGGSATYTMQKPLQCNYYSDAGNYHAQIQRVPQYTVCNVTGAVTPLASWNGAWGGILAVMCKDGMTVNSGASLNASAAGFRGGQGGGDDNGWSGEGDESRSLNDSAPQSENPPGNGGGFAHVSGAGGGNGTAGTSGGEGTVGSASGTPDLSNMDFGGGGAGSGVSTEWRQGGNGGGIIVVAVKQLTVLGSIAANGENGRNVPPAGRGSSGGAGGSILLRTGVASLGSSLVIGNGGIRGSGGCCDNSGGGGLGRVKFEYCEAPTGESYPGANRLKLTCHIADQNTGNPQQGLLNLPQTVASSTVFKAQYGRKLNYASAGYLTSTLRIPAGLVSTGTIQSLVSGLAGNTSFSLDIGDDGSTDWSGTLANNTENTSPDLASAFNAYWATHGSLLTGTLDVPVRVALGGAGQILLTNLRMRLATNTASASNDPPLDVTATFTGNYSAGTWLTYTHALGPNPDSLHPVKVYSAAYGSPLGAGRYGTEFAPGTASGDMFGDGRDGTMPGSGNLDNANGAATGVVNSGSAGSTTINVSDAWGVARINPGDAVLILQTQGTGAGNWELNKAASDFTGGGNFSVQKPLQNTYSTGGSNRAQILRVPQYFVCNVTGTVTPLSAWNGSWGGVLAFICRDTLTGTGSLSASGYGFRGGPGGTKSNDQVNGWSGESTPGPSSQTPGEHNRTPPNNGGGGGGHGNQGGGQGGGGGGAGFGSAGQKYISGQGSHAGEPGGPYGDDGTNWLYLGSGGGGGSASPGNPGAQGGSGGAGGGLIFVTAKQVAFSGSIVANGANGGNAAHIPAYEEGSGGGGSGGMIKIISADAVIGAAIAQGGVPGQPSQNGDSYQEWGGYGGVGRIRLEYCNSLTASAAPLASAQKIACHVVEQVESPPYSQGRLNLPETYNGSRTYKIQYGRRLTYTVASNQLAQLRMPAGLFSSVTMQSLLSGLSGNTTFSIDVGDDGSVEWGGTYGNVSTNNSPDLSAAFNAWWASHGAPQVGTLDVPIRVALGGAGQVLLTNVQTQLSGNPLRYVRLPVRNYSTVAINYTVGGTGSGPMTLAADVGDDGSIDWTTTGMVAFPFSANTANLVTATNAYLAGKSGEVDVPIRFYVSPSSASLTLNSFTATPSQLPDASIALADLSFSDAAPTESDTISVTAVMRNGAARDTGGLVVSAFAILSGTASNASYIGSAFVPNIPASGTATTEIAWNTIGFTGNVPVRIVLDPYNRVSETLETNNVATRTLSIIARPDLQITQADSGGLDEVAAGEVLSLTLRVANHGQRAAVTETLAVYDGNPAQSGVLLSTLVAPPVGGGSTTDLVFAWQPTVGGEHKLFFRADKDNAVNEYDEGNNDLARTLYVGVAGGYDVDSGLLASDPVYSTTLGFGAIDTGQPDALQNCGPLPDDSYRRDPDGAVTYRFDRLLRGRYYHLDIVLRDCVSGSNRLEAIEVNGSVLATGIDLNDGKAHYLSFLLDPKLYDERTITVKISAPGGQGAIVSRVTVREVLYRYVDAGLTTGSDTLWDAARGYGWLSTYNVNTNCGPLPYQTARVNQSGNTLQYRFDGLDPAKRYKVALSLYQCTGSGVTQRLDIDGNVVGADLVAQSGSLLAVTRKVPQTVYQADGSIVVSIIRTNSSANAMIGEVILEEETIATAPVCEGLVRFTPYYSDVFGDVFINGIPAPAGTLVTAENPRGETVGCFAVATMGDYGYLRVFGEDTLSNPPIPGMRAGEPVRFRVDGVVAVGVPLLQWQPDSAFHKVDLNAGATQAQPILLPSGWNFISFRVEPPVPLIDNVLESIAGKYCRVLGLDGASNCALPEAFRTLKQMHSGSGYYTHITSTTSAYATIEGLVQPVDKPIPLQPGWNWIGYYPPAPLPVTVALQSIITYVVQVSQLNSLFVPGDPVHSTLSEMEPGKGYRVYISGTAPLTLTYPVTPALLMGSIIGAPEEKVDPSAAASVCSAVQPTPRMSFIYGDLGTTPGMPAGTLLEALTPDGKLAGCEVTRYAGQYGFMAVFGADADTPGYLTGEPILLRINGSTLRTTSQLWVDDVDVHRVDIAGAYMVFLPKIERAQTESK